MQIQGRILTIKELNRYIKMKLEGDSVLQDVWIRGEISNYTHHSRGHMYFTLKDADSRLKSVMFASHNQKLGFIPRDGSMVLARGSISVFERDGQYQFYVSHMQPDGIGNLYLAYEKLKKQLETEGLFAQEVKKPIPKFPKAVGVITSPTGAAVRDILITLQRRFPTVPVVIYPVLVQGSLAAASIAKAIETMNRLREVDVLIVGRGGGSLEELWAFNEEIVARSIFVSTIPIISAVGHETDFTIADFVADLRAATPTAAAELAVPHQLELKQQLYYYTQRLHQALYQHLKRKQDKLRQLRRSPVLLYPRKQLQQPLERLDRLTEQLAYRMKARLARANEKMIKLEHALSRYNPAEQTVYARKRLRDAQHRVTQSMQAVYKSKKSDFLSRVRHLDALSPLKIMQRGYSLVYDERQKRLIKSIEQVQIGDIVKVRLTDGQLDCHVWSMEEKNDGKG